MRKLQFLFYTGILLLHSIFSFGQYPPPAGFPGTTAMLRDSSVFTGWATSCTIVRGFLNISDTTFMIDGSNKASVGVDANGIGVSDGQVVSLGDGGYASLTFANPVANGSGFDFAVFENGFSNGFLELGFVEVSSDGSHFVRFPSVSLTQTATQIATFDTIDATKINNLAGKYREFFGTPFDLEDLKDSSGIDLKHVICIRVRDVVGSLMPAYATYDSQGHIINDPWPTPFSSGGFDLDAIGVIHYAPQGINENKVSESVHCYPNPVTDQLNVSVFNKQPKSFSLSDVSGRILIEQSCLLKSFTVDVRSLSNGFYFILFNFSDGTSASWKILKQ